MPYITIREMLTDKDHGFDLTMIAGEKGLDRQIEFTKVQKMGLVLAGFLSQLQPGQIQVLGNTEISYLKTLPPEEVKFLVAKICSFSVVCFVVTRGLSPPKELVTECTKNNIALLLTPLFTGTFIDRLLGFLQEKSTPNVYIHGVLVDVLGLGILILGKSGIGKSECALDLITKGYRLIADDVVMVRLSPPDFLYGSSTGQIKHHVEVRGVGIINVKDIFGITAVRDSKRIQLVVELFEWGPEAEEDRLSLEESKYELLGVELPHLKIPVSPGRNLSTIVEVAARNQLLKLMGHDSAKKFLEQHDQNLLRSDSQN
jgi:HPr kinase/phosphorylase